ncbi:hypothetical protein AB6A40_009999 [Gnathostoma spinigerum]|uniref:TFIIS N-terminal domain-containing protein n=1 Tax=Gnathostoma spinigerum TaxID=75299 RepID=A0ABD6EUU6_9BILA
MFYLSFSHFLLSVVLLNGECYFQASLTVELLQSNDTPRFVRKLSKTCIDPDVRKVASDLITNWKNLIANPPPPAAEKPKRVGSAKRKTPHPATKTSSRVSLKVESSTSAELPKVVSGLKLSDGDEKNRETKNKSDEKQQEKTDERTETKLEHKKPDGSTANMEKQDKSVTSDEGAVTKKSSSKLTEFNFTEKLDEERQQKKKRPKTAKTYMSKFRSTGLEGDDESSASGKGAVEAADKKKKPPLSKALLDANRRAAVSSATKSSNTLPTSTVSASSLPAEKKQTATFPRVMMSNTFMDALLDPVLKKNVPKSKRKPSAAVASKTTVSIMPSVMEGLYSDTSSSMGKERNTESSENKDSEPPVIDRDVNPTGKRMIRFADEHGQELVQIRLFEVEEGERINVHRFTSEQMKHMESQRERTFMKEHGSQFGHDTRNDGKIFHPVRYISCL